MNRESAPTENIDAVRLAPDLAGRLRRAIT